jgi:hypothetical protein
MSKEFKLDFTSKREEINNKFGPTISGFLVIGKNGIKLTGEKIDNKTTVIDVNKGIRTAWIAFEDILMMDSYENITLYPQNNAMSFDIKCTTIDTPLIEERFSLKLYGGSDSAEAYKLISDGYLKACSDKDKIIGL